MENPENVLMELGLLEKNPQITAIPQCLDEYLGYVAKTGNALFAWPKVKPLFKRKLELIIQDRVATKIFEGFGKALFKEFFKGREPVSSIHYTRPGTCINRPLH